MPKLDPTLIEKVTKSLTMFWTILYSFFAHIFGVQTNVKLRQDGPPKRSKSAKRAKTCILLSIVFLEHQASQDRPKRSQKAAKMASGSIQELFKTESLFLLYFDSKIAPQNGPKSCPEIVQKLV